VTDEFVILSQRDLGELMTFTDYVEAVTEDFNFSPKAVASPPLPIEIAGQYGTFRVKAGGSAPRARLHGS